MFLKSVLIVIAMQCVRADVIEVPGDHNSIQAAVNASSAGDTVLVADGLYSQNVDFNGRAILLTSHYMLDENPEHIAATIIRGAGSGSCVRFDSDEGPDSRISGFTLTEGADYYGGGIYCLESSPTLSNLIIDNNSATYGGGIAFMSGSNSVCSKLVVSNNSGTEGGGLYLHNLGNVTIEDSKIFGNNSDHGGGMLITYSDPQISRTLIYDNDSPFGGGVYVFNYSQPTFSNVTVANNSADYGGGFYCIDLGGQPELINCIVWANQPDGLVSFSSYYAPLVSYSDMQGATDEDWFSDSCIESDPLFFDQTSSDFHLTAVSPCIDSGDPTFPPDADGTVSDMGALPFVQSEFGNLGGQITSAETGLPIAGALVLAGAYQALSSIEGTYLFENLLVAEYDLVASAESYLTANQTAVVTDGGSAVADFQLAVDYSFAVTQSFPLPDSPTQVAYPDNPPDGQYENSWNDLGWTEIVVEDISEVKGVSLSLTWNSLDYSNEGSLWLVSPAETEIPLYYSESLGAVALDLSTDEFNGENAAGSWIIYMHDSYGDGGHQVTEAEISIQFARMMTVTDLSVEILTDNEAQLSWCPPNPFLTRSISGYSILLDGEPVGETADTLFVLQNLIIDQDYLAEILVDYDEGQSEAVALEFTYQLTAIDPTQEAYTFELLGNYPNPFNPTTAISYRLAQRAPVELQIYNLNGQIVRNLVSRIEGPGEFQVNWNGENDRQVQVASGLYFYTLMSGNQLRKGRMILLK